MGVRAVYAGWLTMYVIYALCVLASALGLKPFDGAAFACGIGGVAALTGLSFARLSRDGQSASTLVPPAPRGRALRPEYTLGWLAALVLSATAGLAWLAPIGAYDAIGYRIPAIAQWLDAGGVVWVPGDDMLRNGYPLGLEVLEAALASASGGFTAIDVLGVSFVALGAGLVFSEACALGLGTAPSALAAGLFALVPMHVLNAPSGYADAPFSAALVGLWLLAARFARGDVGLTLRVLCGVLAGFTIALKPPGVAYAGLALGAAWIVRARRTSLGESTRALLVPLCVLTPGLFFLVRNVAIAHNPLYPVEVRAFGHVIFPGEGSLDGILTPDANVPKVLRGLPRLLRTPTVWLELWGPARAFDERLAGLGYTFPLAALPACAWALYRGLRERLPLYGLGLVLPLTLATFALQPFSFWPRFTTWLWGAGALALALALRELARTRTALAAALSWLVVLGVGGEALYALWHVKFVGALGAGIHAGDRADQLAAASGVSADFVRRALVGRPDVCRTAWTDGTDDANLDGVVAQLSPRPRMHVVIASDWPSARTQLAAFGCDALIAIGLSPLRGAWPDDVTLRPARAFGMVDVFEFAR